MKNTKKIFATICVLALLVLSLTVIAIADDAPAYTGKIEEFKAKVDAVEIAGDTEAQRNALWEVGVYIKDNPVDPKSDGYDAVVAKYNAKTVEIAGVLLTKINPEDGPARNGANLNKATSIWFANTLLAPETTGYAEVKAKLDEQIAIQNEKLQNAKDAVESGVDFEEYDWKTYTSLPFDDKAQLPSLGNQGSNKVSLEKEPGSDNTYMQLKYIAAAHTFTSTNIGDPSKGIVIEVDYTTFGTFPGVSVNFESNSTGNSSSKERVYPCYFKVMPNGDLTDRTGKVLMPAVVVPGAWTHFSFVFDPVTCEGDVYCNYEYAGHVTTIPQEGVTYELYHLRIGCNSPAGEFALDNLNIYQGTGIRTPGKFDNMTDDEMFTYYCSILKNPSATDNSKKVSYDYARGLIGNYWKPAEGENPGTYLTDDAKIRAAVDTYLAFDIEGLTERIKVTNLAEYTKMVNEFKKMERKPDTLAKRRDLLTKITAFTEKVGNDIIQNDEYVNNTAVVTQGLLDVEKEERMVEFIDYMGRFEKTSTISFLEKYYAQVVEIVEKGLDMALLENPAYTDFQHAWEVYQSAPEKLYTATCKDNSKRIVVCVGFIEVYKTEEEWKANYDYINKYVTSLRKIIKDKTYDPYYPGVSAAIEKFNPINEYFYADLQLKHIEIISAQLQNYRNTESYVEKMGACAFVERYIASNDLDPNNETLNNLIIEHKSYKGELATQEEDYNRILEQNTVYFLNLVEKLQTTTDFASMDKVYTEASVYYYAMNIGSPEAQAAIKVFDGYTEIVNLVKESSQKFIENVEMLAKAESDDETYATLVNCFVYAENADESIAGVKDAMAKYEKAYNAYMGVVDAANTEIEATGTAVGSLRANCAAPSVVAVIMKKVIG